LAPIDVHAMLIHRLAEWTAATRMSLSLNHVLSCSRDSDSIRKGKLIDANAFVFNKYGPNLNDAEVVGELRNESGEVQARKAVRSFRLFLERQAPGSPAYNDMLDAYIELHEQGKALITGDGGASLGGFSGLVHVEVGPGNNLLPMVDEAGKSGKHLVIVDNNEDIVNFTRRYAEKLGLKNVSAVHADASKPSFLAGIRRVLAERHDGMPVDTVRASHIMRYLETEGERLSFLKSCHALMRQGGELFVFEKESRIFTPGEGKLGELKTKGMEAHFEEREGIHLARFYDIKSLAKKAGFLMERHVLKPHGSARQKQAGELFMRESVLRKP
jgi:hypothetical protein